MIGAIGGDIAGSFREFSNNKHPELGIFPSLDMMSPEQVNQYGITDDSILTIATANAFLDGKTEVSDFANYYHAYGNKYNTPIGAYGSGFKKWLRSPDKQPYNSCGNGSAMRISPVAYFCSSIEEVLELAKNSASCTHDHPEGIKGAQSVAVRMWMNINQFPLEEINAMLVKHNLTYNSRTKPFMHFDATCQYSMQLVTGIFDKLEYNQWSYEHAVFKAVTLPNADSDTLGAIVGGIAETMYGMNDETENKIVSNQFFKDYPDLFKVVNEFLVYRNAKFVD